jgi:hypothetical protein
MIADTVPTLPYARFLRTTTTRKKAFSATEGDAVESDGTPSPVRKQDNSHCQPSAQQHLGGGGGHAAQQQPGMPSPAPPAAQKQGAESPTGQGVSIVLNQAAARSIMVNMAMSLSVKSKTKLVAPNDVKKYVDAAIKLQSWWRMSRVCKESVLSPFFLKKQLRRSKAATDVQRVYRAYMARHKNKDLDLRIALRILEHMAALKVQRVVRGHNGRVRFDKTKKYGDSVYVERACLLLQRQMRGWSSRRKTRQSAQSLRAKVLVIERFCIRYFQPWFRAQMHAWNKNLWCIVAVQSRTRRFLAVKRTTGIRKTQADMFVQGVWLLLWVALLAFYFAATTVSRIEETATSHVVMALDRHLSSASRAMHTFAVPLDSVSTPHLRECFDSPSLPCHFWAYMFTRGNVHF